MNAIKITTAVAAELTNNSWIIVNQDYVVGTYKSRQAARDAKAANGLEGSIKNKSEVEFEVVELVEESKPYGYEHHGFINCPHCGIHLDNGVGEHLQEVNGKQIKHDKYEYKCLACGNEFGHEIGKVTKDAPAKTGRKVEVTHLSTVERPCKKVWAIADEMHAANPDCKRREVLAECVNQGIAFYTARTQYQQWLGIQKEMAERVAAQAAKK